MTTTSAQSLSERGQYTFRKADCLCHCYEKSVKNAFHPEKNPKGVINLGTAVDRLMENEIEQHMVTIGAFKFKSSEHQHYYDFRGKFTLRVTIANFLQRYFNAAEEILPDNIIVQSGSATCLDSLAYAIFDPGDVYITPTPTYGRIFANLNDRSLAQPVPLHLSEEPDSTGRTFVLTAKLLEDRILQLKKQEKCVKGFLLVNPQNPLGDIYSQHLLQSLLKVCAKYELHAIIDEVYALTLLDGNEVSSVLGVRNVPDPLRTHFVWALSKDFGLAGVRVGVIHTKNPALLKVLVDVSMFCPTASIIQDMATSLLSDTKWLDEEFFPRRRQRLEEKYHLVKKRLEATGIKVRPCKAGLFVWFDLKKYLRYPSTESEMELFEEFMENGVCIVPGSQLYCDAPGWFRIVFAFSSDHIDEGLKRIEKVLKRRKDYSSHEKI